VRGAADVVQRIVDCWASGFAPRVLVYRARHGIDREPAVAVVVQLMVDVARSGVMFTVDPSTGDRSRMAIEGAIGQGEVVVGGLVEPDTYLVERNGRLRIVQARTGHQDFAIRRGADGADERVELDAGDAAARVLLDHEVLQIAQVGTEIEAHYGEPQDIEWALSADGALWIVQSRPITTLDGARPPAGGGRALVTGLAASPGLGVGKVRVLSSPEMGKQLLSGEVLVAPMTNPDWVPTLRRAKAVVTDGGGMTCHAAIVARELGIPAVVGARSATTVLRDGELVTVDGAKGVVLEGDTRSEIPTVPAAAVAAVGPESLATPARGTQL
jgi:pyruvate,water dikinase